MPPDFGPPKAAPDPELPAGAGQRRWHHLEAADDHGAVEPHRTWRFWRGYHQATGWHWHVPNFETRKVQRMVQHANTLRKWMKAGQIQDERQLAIVVFILLHDMWIKTMAWWLFVIYQYLSPIRQFPHRSTINHHRQVLHAPMAPLSRTAARGLRLRRVLFFLRVSMGGETALA
jgi:hypothetical protein